MTSEHGGSRVGSAIACEEKPRGPELQYVDGTQFMSTPTSDRNPTLILAGLLGKRRYLILVEKSSDRSVIKANSEGKVVFDRITSTPEMRLLRSAFLGCDVRYHSEVRDCVSGVMEL